ncbi:ATP synthase F1 subunit delta [Lacihabitans sp. LS3-19]|uniref:ATP synthase F1 subunit delta n=1 Tax=Lacihabitans sp. LS3-19 TaxID=2487335 RepID=UPI0020CDA2EB|nr:ATP synthase F1 subunit delta [Lacihabitans sp. LS3-19]MCP9770901.1 ATP synthase F1 subunit delta [Lacihabitans sp. LS3-19]
MSESIVAYRYAKALIDLANEQGVVKEVNQDMSFFEMVCQENDNFVAVMANPIVRHDKKLSILKKIFENKVNNVTFSIFKVLTKKNREKLIYPIAKEFQKLFNLQTGVQIVEVSSAVALTDTQRSQFSKIVADAIHKEIKLEESVDESLIGGYVLRVGDTQIDTSVKKKLNELKLALA